MSGGENQSFTLQLPLERCVQVLKRVALSQKSDGSTASCTSTNQVSGSLKWKESEKLWDVDIDQIDLLPYCVDVIEETRRSQVEAAMTVLRSALTSMVAVEKSGLECIDATGNRSAEEDGSANLGSPELSFGIQTASLKLMAYNKDLEMVALV
jgi:hypothetical protein